MSFVDDMKHQIEDSLRQADENLDWISTNGPVIIDHLLNIYLKTWPIAGPMVNPIADQAKAALADHVREGRLVVAVLRMEVQYVGSPDNLRAAADTIDSSFVTPARELADRLVLGNIPSALPSNYDDGVASETYRAKIDGRDAAVRDIDTYATPIGQSLRDLADGIESYFTSLRDITLAVLAFIVSLVLLIVGWETIVIGVIGVVGMIISAITLYNQVTDLIDDTETTTADVIGTFEATIPAWPAVLQ